VAQALAIAAAAVSMLALLPMVVLSGYAVSLAFRAKGRPGRDESR